VLQHADCGDQGSAEKLRALEADHYSAGAVPAAPKRRGPAELSAGRLGVVMNLPTLAAPRRATLARMLAYPIGYAAIFEQATHLPDNVKKIHYALANSVLSQATTLLTLAFGSLSASSAYDRSRGC
jgi:hypothetical protein